jgi:hypothetical protein
MQLKIAEIELESLFLREQLRDDGILVENEV